MKELIKRVEKLTDLIKVGGATPFDLTPEGSINNLLTGTPVEQIEKCIELGHFTVKQLNETLDNLENVEAAKKDRVLRMFESRNEAFEAMENCNCGKHWTDESGNVCFYEYK